MEDINEKTPKKISTPLKCFRGVKTFPTNVVKKIVVRIDFNHLKRDLGGFVHGAL